MNLRLAMRMLRKQPLFSGAILVMLADTMIREAFEHGGKLAGVVNDTAVVLGFRAQIVFRHWMRRYAVAARTGLRIA